MSPGALAASIAEYSLLYSFAHAASAVLDPAKRELAYYANLTVPNVMPGISEVMSLWYADRITYPDMVELLRYQGIEQVGSTPDAGLKPRQKAWKWLTMNARPRFGLSEYLLWHRQGRLGRDWLQERLRQRGITDPSDIVLFIDQWDNINTDTVIDLYKRGWLTYQEANQVLLAHNYRANDITIMLETPKAVDLPQSIQLVNRGLLTQENFKRNIRNLGFQRTSDIDALAELRKVLPSVSELIVMMIKDTFTPQIAEPAGLYDEHPVQIDEWFRRLGYDWKLGFNINVDGVQREATMIDMQWAAHWRTMSPEQAAELSYRMRPGREARWQGVLPGIPAFTADDLNRHLRIADVSPPLRKWIAALGFTQLRIFDVRNAVKYRMRNRAWAVDAYKDRGLIDDDANLAADLSIRLRDDFEDRFNEATRRAERRRLQEALLEGYSLGYVNENDTRFNLNNLGVPAQAANDMVLRAFVQRTEKQLRQSLATIRTDYRHGVIDRNEVRNRLSLIGITPDMVDWYMNQWTITLSQRVRQFNGAKIIDFVKRGLMPLTEAARRLQNLGWQNVDILLMTLAAQQDQNKAAAKVLTNAAKSAKSQADSLARLAKQQQEALRRTQAEMRSLTPVSTLAKWLKSSVINEAQFMARLEMMGYSPAIAADYLRQAQLEAAENYAKKQASGKTEKPQNGQEVTQGPEAP